jgi:serine/threonine protein kinase/TolB-like protein
MPVVRAVFPNEFAHLSAHVGKNCVARLWLYGRICESQRQLMTLAIGSRLGPYEIVAAIGAGGMGEVFRARDTKLDRDVALKVLPARATADDTARARLAREARLAASLNHPSICTIHEVGEFDGLTYVAMELIAGRPLADLIPATGFSIDVVLRYGVQIAEGLAHAHARRIVHRDLKSANVLITPDGRVKVLDFGLATRQATDVEDATRSVVSLDAPGTVVGTLAYMAPEALRGESADLRSDVWSFGVLLYEMTSGRRPFLGKSGVDMTSSIVRDHAPPLPSTAAPGLKAIIERCLHKEPARRYADAGEVLAALETLRADPGRAGPRTSPSRRFVVASIAAMVVVIIAVLALWGRSRFAASPRARSAARVQSLAVLPLEDLSGDASQAYFADGLTEELITRLSKITGLSVTSRTTVMQFKQSGRPVADIARQLGVQAVVEGTISRSADRVRITARLVDAAAGTSLWAERYDRAVSDVLGIQADVASAIGDAIRTNITPQERQRLSSLTSSNAQAYDLYLRGRFHEARESPDEIRQAIDFFERAVAADPQFAAAHAELARAYWQHLFYVTPGDLSLQERAFVSIERALAIDPALDAAYVARGLLLWTPWNRFPHERAIGEYRRAIALNPNADEAHHQLGLVYLHIGLLDEAMREVHEAMRLNPANTLAHFREGVGFFYQGRYAQAVDVFKQTPDGFQPPLRAFQLADALFHLGRKDEARAAASAYLRTNPGDLGGMNTAMLAMLAADSGNVDRAIELVRTAEKGNGYGHFHHSAFTIARAFALAARADEAVSWLEKAAADGYPCYPVFVNDTTLDRIRGDRRFQDFLTAQQSLWERHKKLAQ